MQRRSRQGEPPRAFSPADALSALRSRWSQVQAHLRDESLPSSGEGAGLRGAGWAASAPPAALLFQAALHVTAAWTWYTRAEPASRPPLPPQSAPKRMGRLPLWAARRGASQSCTARCVPFWCGSADPGLGCRTAALLSFVSTSVLGTWPQLGCRWPPSSAPAPCPAPPTPSRPAHPLPAWAPSSAGGKLTSQATLFQQPAATTDN